MIRVKKRFDKAGHAWRQRPRHLSRWKKILLAALLAAAAYWLFFSGSGAKDHKKPEPLILTATATVKDVPVYLNGLGTVQGFNAVTVRPQVDGQLAEVSFREGQDIRKGEVLAKIDPRTYQAQYDQAVANKAKDAALLENAKRDLARYVKLGKAVSDQQRDTQAATVRQLEATTAADQAAIDNAKTLLSYTTILAPIDGRTGIRQVDAGNIIHTNDANGLVVITQIEPVSVLFSLPQQNLPAINEQLGRGNRLTVFAIDDTQTVSDTGTLELVDNQIDPNTGTIRLKATFPNSKHALWPGGFTNVRLLVTTRQGAIVVPASSVQRGPQNSYVYIYKQGEKENSGTVEMRPVTIAMTEGQDTVISEGVKEGEHIVTDGMGKLQDGSKVRVACATADDGCRMTDDGKKNGDKKKDGDASRKHPHKQDKKE